MEIRSRRGGMFYGSLFLMTILCCGLSTLLVFVAVDRAAVDYTLLFFALIFILILVFTYIQFLKNLPIVTMSDEGITYSGHRYGWTQVVSADFTSQRRFATQGRGKAMDVIVLRFDDGKEFCIFDSMYWNGDEIRRYLQTRVNAELRNAQVIAAEIPDEAVAKNQKRKANIFAFCFVTSALLVSFLIAFYNVSKGVSIFIIVLYNVLFIGVFIKMFRKKQNDGNSSNGTSV